MTGEHPETGLRQTSGADKKKKKKKRFPALRTAAITDEASCNKSENTITAAFEK